MASGDNGGSWPSNRRRWAWPAFMLATTLASLWTLYAAGTGDAPKANAGAQLGTQLGAQNVSTIDLGLARATAAAKLEQMLDASPLLGPCLLGVPLLPELRAQACRAPTCLWSEHAGANIDLGGEGSESSSGDGDSDGSSPPTVGTTCSPAAGGQLPAPEGPPRVSFVFVVHNNSQVGARTFLELFLSAGEVESAEYVVVNVGAAANGTPRPALQAAQRLQELFGIQLRVLRVQSRSSAHTRGIEAAVGEYVALVDSYTFVARGWLGASLATFARQPRAAAVGPLLLGTGNAIYEAGGILDSQGWAVPFARGQRMRPDLYYLREVDYVSLDCVLLRRAALRQLWGLDDQFRTRRYKAADLALAARAAGMRALLQPLALAFIQAATSGGAALPAAAEEHDRRLLLYKWGGVLGSKHCPRGADALDAATRHGAPRLLWVDDTPPQPDKDSGSIRSLNMLQVLLWEGYHVTMLTTHSATHARYPAQMRHLGVLVLPKMDPASWPLARGGQCDYDVALVARRDVYLACEKVLAQQCPSMPIVYDTVDLHFLREARDVLTAPPQGQKGTTRGWAAAANLTAARVADWLASDAPKAAALRAARGVELRLVSASALTVVVSHQEVEMIRRYRPRAPLAVVSNVHVVERPPDTRCAGRSGLLFVGNMNHPPNRQALEALVLDVLPRVLRLLPWRERRALRLHVVASNDVPEELARLLHKHSAHVVFHGYLPDEELFALYNRTMVAVAPLLSGAGVKGKVNQAMKLGVPIVATPLAMEGTYAEDGHECLMASDPEAFASKVARVYTDCALWARLVEGGYRNVQRHFSREMGGPALLQALNRIGMGPLHSFRRDVCRAREAQLSPMQPQSSRPQ